MNIETSYSDTRRKLHSALRVDNSFDLLERDIVVGGKRTTLFFVDAFTKDAVMEKVFEFLMRISEEEMQSLKDANSFASYSLPYIKISFETDTDTVVTSVLSGITAMVVEGYADVLLIDVRSYPVRGIDEPQDDRVLRGSHDGFVEALAFNTAMIRRRIRDPRITFEIVKVGSKSRTDIAICYLEGCCDQKHLAMIRSKLQSITIPSLSMGQESLLECLCRRQRYNPFPKVRYTERPDSAAASVAEGKILLLVDNSPSAMLLPTGFFDFMQDTNDYYFPPLIGSYLRFLRTAVLILSLFLTPFWFLLMQNEWEVPTSLAFLKVSEPNSVPILIQLLAIELIIDVVKLASLNTPNTLSNAFSVVGALIFGEFAVRANLFVPEVLLYMAFVSVSAFTQASYEMGYAFKLMRIVFLLLTAAFNVWGFVAGVALLILLISTTQTPLGYTYLYPLIPFNGRALMRLFSRRSISRFNS